MIRIDPSNWTADFRIARGLAEAYHSSGCHDVVLLCVGDPDDRLGRLGPLVGDEAVKYHPKVIGTSDDPVTSETIEEKWQQLLSDHVGSYVIGIEAGYGKLGYLGSVEITDRGFSTLTGWDDHDVTINVVLRVQDEAHTSKKRMIDEAATEAASSGLTEALLEVGSDVPDEDGGSDGGQAGYGGRFKFKPLLPSEIYDARVIALSDTIIDGFLRFLSRIGKQKL